MNVRAYRETDVTALRELYDRQGFDYPFPDFADPVFFAGAVSNDGKSAAFLRKAAQAYLFLGEVPTRERWQLFLELHEAMRQAAISWGLREVFCWIPPEIPDRFCKRLTALGWREDKWRNFTFNL